jgi:hypothetical protein
LTNKEPFVNNIITANKLADLYALEVNNENIFNQARSILLKMMNATIIF